MPKSLALIMTDRCNLCCSYCYCKLTPQPERFDLSPARAIDELIRGDYRAATFFGGEPLLAFDAMRKIVAARPTVIIKKNKGEKLTPEERNREFRYSITTNGTLITPEIADWFAENKIHPQLSLDGPADLHAATRGQAGLKAFSGLELLNQRGIKPGVRSTLVFRNGKYHVAEVVRWHNQLMRQGKISSAHWSCDDYAAINPLINNELEATYDWLVAERASKRNVRWRNFDRYVEAILKNINEGVTRGDRPRKQRTCGAGRSYFTLTSRGDLIGCHRQIAGCEKIDEFVKMPDCSGCELIGICGGNCRAMNLHFNGSSAIHCKPFCDLERYIFKLAKRYVRSRISIKILE